MRTSAKNRLADDLFVRSEMSFLEHLEELRRTLLKATLWLVLGTCVGLNFANSVVHQLKKPMEEAIRQSEIEQAKKKFEQSNGFEPPDELSQLMDKFEVFPELILIDPDEERSSILGLDSVAAHTTKPVTSVTDPWQLITADSLKRLSPRVNWRKMPTKLKALSPTEPFTIWLKAGVMTGIVISSPGIFWHLWQFLAAGLYPHERRQVYWYFPLSLTLFLTGTLFAFYVLLQLILSFLISYGNSLDIDFTPRLNEYLTFALYLPVGFGIAFQLPVVMLGLNRFGVIPIEAYIEQWRMAVLGIAFLSMILTPQEVYSMLGMFIPLTGLYFLGIALCKYMPGAGNQLRLKRL